MKIASLERFSFAAIITTLLVASSTTLQLFKDGGARPEGYAYSVDYSGPIDLIVPAWSGVAALCLLGALTRSLGTVRDFAGIPTLLGFIAVMSSAWAPDPAGSLRSALILLLGILAIAAYSRRTGSQTQFRNILLIFASGCMASAACIVLVPSFGVSVGQHEGAWQGIFTHKNELGSISVFTLALALGYSRVYGGWKPILLCLVCIALIAGTKSSTAAICAVLVFAVHLALRVPIFSKVLKRSTVILVFLLAAALPASLFVSGSHGAFQIAGKDTTFSGRVYIWGYFYSRISEKPLLGHGYNSFRTLVSDEEKTMRSEVGFIASSSHNGYLDAAFSNGYVGLTAFMLMLIAILRSSIRTIYFIPTIYVLLVYVAINQLESKGPSFNTHFFAMVCWYGLLRMANRERSKVRIPPDHEFRS